MAGGNRLLDEARAGGTGGAENGELHDGFLSAAALLDAAVQREVRAQRRRHSARYRSRAGGGSPLRTCVLVAADAPSSIQGRNSVPPRSPWLLPAALPNAAEPRAPRCAATSEGLVFLVPHVGGQRLSQVAGSLGQAAAEELDAT